MGEKHRERIQHQPLGETKRGNRNKDMKRDWKYYKSTGGWYSVCIEGDSMCVYAFMILIRNEGFARTGYFIPVREEGGDWEIHVSSVVAAAAPWLEPPKYVTSWKMNCRTSYFERFRDQIVVYCHLLAFG